MSDPVPATPASSPLHTRQVLFVRCLGRLIQYATERGYELTLGEGFVQSPRRSRDGRFVEDGVHMPDSMHYQRLACDLNLFVRGEYITDSHNMAWLDLGDFWRSLDPLCRWGGDFKKRDGNHVSISYQGRA